ncbi:LytR/AlgR family response regulator transcription factor [Pseudogracilibacillus auburnensis]|uniref:LytR/AlgR family response regulator transcription factor n=1 Tax=Pseudogracilibacillus auburnensis TaxID=1494959 RepID=UPI00362573D4
MKAICIDDEQLALEYLKRQIMKLNGIEVIGTFIHPIEGKEHILTEEVDVIFLDIHLPEINGIELAEQIINEKPDLIVVFVTAYDQYAVKAFELNALDYLVKPVKLDRLRLTLDRVRKQLNVKEEKKA